MTQSHVTDLHAAGILRIIGVFCIICGYRNKNGYNKYTTYPVNHNSQSLQHDGVARNTSVYSRKSSHNGSILYNMQLSKLKMDTIISIPLTLSTTAVKASGMMESHVVDPHAAEILCVMGIFCIICGYRNQKQIQYYSPTNMFRIHNLQR